jgi:hypothetical protein
MEHEADDAAAKLPAAQLTHEPAPAEALEVPALQLRQVVEPVDAWNLPALQSMHLAAAAPEYWPAAHASHLAPVLKKPATQVSGSQVVAPIDVKVPLLLAHVVHPVDNAVAANLPAAHAVQLVRPLESENLPATHETHWEPPVVSLYVPGRQAVQLPWPAAEIVPVEHDKHEVGPAAATSTAENLPASQFLQLLWPALSWKVPFMHGEHEADEEAEEKVPTVQLAHDPAPTVALKEPALQLRQEDEPVAVWNLPTSQLMHASECALEE